MQRSSRWIGAGPAATTALQLVVFHRSLSHHRCCHFSTNQADRRSSFFFFLKPGGSKDKKGSSLMALFIPADNNTFSRTAYNWFITSQWFTKSMITQRDITWDDQENNCARCKLYIYTSDFIHTGYFYFVLGARYRVFICENLYEQEVNGSAAHASQMLFLLDCQQPHYKSTNASTSSGCKDTQTDTQYFKITCFPKQMELFL